ncbi:hypothetical protein BO71DRAFT_402006, partial [Aspergillus ellipticus CBS 707.79]
MQVLPGKNYLKLLINRCTQEIYLSLCLGILQGTCLLVGTDMYLPGRVVRKLSAYLG